MRQHYFSRETDNLLVNLLSKALFFFNIIKTLWLPGHSPSYLFLLSGSGATTVLLWIELNNIRRSNLLLLSPFGWGESEDRVWVDCFGCLLMSLKGFVL